jgi:FAD/FMN-containing dehydrogenase
MLGLPGTALDVGVVGYTVHGGIGWLTRRHGLASGRLTAVEFIDGTGAARRADENSDPELLWAFRGGGGLGIVTAAGFELVPAGDLHAGFMLWPAGAASEVIGASIWPWPAARGRPRHRPCPAPCLRSPAGAEHSRPLRRSTTRRHSPRPSRRGPGGRPGPVAQ